jgi:hypothetical protein
LGLIRKVDFESIGHPFPRLALLHFHADRTWRPQGSAVRREDNPR